MSIKTMKKLSAYELEASRMTLADIPRLHELSASVGWPHRAENWRMLIRHGDGIVARDEIGRVVGSAMWFPHGPNHVNIGMVITSPRLQAYGTGNWLMQHVLQRVAGRDSLLNATRAAIRLYVSLGFVPDGQVYQHQGIVASAPDGHQGARAADTTDIPTIYDLDYKAIGVDRSEVLGQLLQRAQTTVIEREGEVVGFALCRPFGHGHVIGPVVATTETDAMALARPHVEAHYGRFLRLDTAEPHGNLRNFLEASGMHCVDVLTHMALNSEPGKRGPARTFGLASHTLG